MSGVRFGIVVSAVMLPVALAGCGGGGGVAAATGESTSGSPNVSTKPEKLFPLASNATTSRTGIGRQFAYTFKDSNGLGEETTADAPTAPEDVPVEFKTDANGNIVSGSIKTKTTLLAVNGFSKVTDDEITDAEAGIQYIAYKKEADDRSTTFGIVDPEPLQFSYQTFGLWETITDGNGSGGSGKDGAFSFGNVTTGKELPATGTATFTGKSIGWHTNGNEIPETVASNVTLNADFAGRKVDYASTVISGSRTHLGMTGSMTYSAGSNSLSGTAQTAAGPTGPALTGTIDGRFYGSGTDAAREIGGTFGLTSATETYIGAYGASKK